MSTPSPDDVALLATLAPYILAILGIGGTLGGVLLAGRLSRKREDRKLKLERLEELLATLYEHESTYHDASDSIQRAYASEEITFPAPNRIALERIRAIAALFFPELEVEVTAVLDTSFAWYQQMGENTLRHNQVARALAADPSNVNAFKDASIDIAEGNNKAIGEFVVARNALTEKAIMLAHDK